MNCKGQRLKPGLEAISKRWGSRVRIVSVNADWVAVDVLETRKGLDPFQTVLQKSYFREDYILESHEEFSRWKQELTEDREFYLKHLIC